MKESGAFARCTKLTFTLMKIEVVDSAFHFEHKIHHNAPKLGYCFLLFYVPLPPLLPFRVRFCSIFGFGPCVC